MQPTQESTESLGTYLKRAREEKNVSIEQVAYATRISLKMLRALEVDDHTSLPAPTFVRGYLQAYAKYVRLDTQDLLLRYQHHLATAPDSKRGNIRSHYLYVRERYQEKRRLVLVIVLFATMLSVAGAYFFLKSQREKRKMLARTAEQISKSEEVKPPAIATAVEMSKETKPAETTNKPAATAEKPVEPVKPAEVAVAKPAETVKPAEPPKPSEPPKQPELSKPMEVARAGDQKRQFNLLLRANEDVWFRFQTDEEEVKDLTLRSGKAMMLRADKVIKIFSGNLNAMKANLNGKDLAALAPAKGVKSAVLPDTEAPNYKLPLFPQFQPKTAPVLDGAERKNSASDTEPAPPSALNPPPNP